MSKSDYLVLCTGATACSPCSCGFVSQRGSTSCSIETSAQNLLTLSSPLKSSKFEEISFWYETSSSCSFLVGDAVDGTPVLSWLDTSKRNMRNDAMAGQRTDSTQFTYNSNYGPTSGPKYLQNGINNLPSLRFTNSPTQFEYLAVNPTFQMDSGNNKNITLFIVLRIVSGSAGFIVDRVCAKNDYPLFGFDLDSSRNILFDARDDSGAGAGGGFHFYTGGSLNLDEPYVLTLQRILGNSFSVRLNGQTLPTTVQDHIGSITLQPMKIGRHCSNTNWDPGMMIDISEMALMFDPVSDYDVRGIETYLGQKYNIFIENAMCSPGRFLVPSNKVLSNALCMPCTAGTYSSQQGSLITS